MKKIFLSVLVILFSAFWTAQAVARCAYYGPPYNAYRCMPDKAGTPKAKRGGGTGGKVFKKMEENEKECGYFDPGCQKQKRGPSPDAEGGEEYEGGDEGEEDQ